MRLVRVYAGNENSLGAKNLARELGVLRIKHTGSQFVPTPRHKIINWGSTNVPEVLVDANWINEPTSVLMSSNKLTFFQVNRDQEGFKVPVWTDQLEVARAWSEAGTRIYARTILNGHSGRGIVVIEHSGEFVNAPLYTKALRRDAEYRVHVVNGQVIDTQKKIRNPEVEVVDWRVRSHQNGFMYVRNNVQPDERVLRSAVAAVASVDLVFGACDVVWNEAKQQATVLEVNTAPGIQGQTVLNYARAFRELLGQEPEG